MFFDTVYDTNERQALKILDGVKRTACEVDRLSRRLDDGGMAAGQRHQMSLELLDDLERLSNLAELEKQHMTCGLHGDAARQVCECMDGVGKCLVGGALSLVMIQLRQVRDQAHNIVVGRADCSLGRGGALRQTLDGLYLIVVSLGGDEVLNDDDRALIEDAYRLVDLVIEQDDCRVWLPAFSSSVA